MDIVFPQGKRVDAHIQDLIIQTDQAVKNGGEGSAAEPFQLFLASIGTCAGIYALSFCQSRKIETDGMGITMDWSYDESRKRIDKLSIKLRLPAEFPERYKSAVIRAMDLCSVKKTILNPPEFELEAV
jgi:ribosomal protein S12 methylthiotransferase accessory factor